MPIEEYNEVFDEPTPARAKGADGNGQTREEKPAEPPAAKPASARPVKPARGRTVAEKPAELSKDELGDWQWRLGASARKAVAAQRRAQEAALAWERVVMQARIEGVPERMLMAAALEADIDLPADS